MNLARKTCHILLVIYILTSTRSWDAFLRIRSDEAERKVCNCAGGWNGMKTVDDLTIHVYKVLPANKEGYFSLKL